jgi:hypothetical protein
MALDQEGSNFQWSVVKEWSGGRGVEHEPEPFTRPAARSWRIAYRTEAEKNVAGVVDVVILTKDHKMVASAYNLQGKVSGFFTVTGEETEYYLEVKSYGPDWWVAVEQAQ